jgi:hypothetical protein
MKRFRSAALYGLYVVISSYLLLEVALYVSLANGWYAPNLDNPYFDKPPAVFDEVRGGRWLNNGVRTTRVGRGLLIYEPTQFPVDSRGYIGRPPFSDRRPRFAVLGDSFTDLYSVERNWVSQAASRRHAAFVSFAVDGGGIANWHSVFFNEILKDREGFDGLIVAAYGPDLRRRFFTATSDEIFYYGNRYDSPEAVKADRTALKACPIALVVPPSLMQWVVAVTKKQYSFGLNTAFLLYLYGADFVGEQMRRTGCRQTDFGPVSRFDMLNEIVDAAVKRGIMVVIATVPARDELIDYLRKGTLPRDALEIGSFAEKNGVALFDGFKAFAEAKPDGMDAADFVHSNWLRIDGHWAQNGSDLFANAIADYLDRSGPGPHVEKSKP